MSLKFDKILMKLSPLILLKFQCCPSKLLVGADLRVVDELQRFGVAGPAANELGAGGVADASATTHHSFGGSFSAGSKPIFASKYAFFSIFQNLQENHLSRANLANFCQKKCKVLPKKVTFSGKFCKVL